MRYFITGGAGFIGSNFVDLLMRTERANTELVTVYDKLTYAGNLKNLSEWQSDPRLNIRIADICDREVLSQAMTNHDVVVHFAAESHVDRSIKSATPFVTTNVLGTLNVLEAARSNDVNTIIHISTDEVYGSLAEGTATEESPLLPNSPYAASKAASDLLARSFYQTYNMDIRITRCSNNYGRFQYPEKLIPVVINAILRNQQIPVYGTGINVREWIHVTDHGKAILEVLQNGKPGEIYNIGSTNYLTNLELVKKICNIMGHGEELIEYVEDRLGHDFRYSIDYSKLKIFGLPDQVDFETGLQQTVEWYLTHQEWWM